MSSPSSESATRACRHGLDALVVRDLTVSFGARTVIDGLDLVVARGRRLALVGENGSGKSTLLRAVAGRLPRRARRSGRVQAPADLVHLGQAPPFRDHHTVAQVLATTLRPLRQAVADVERLAAQLPGREEEYAARLEWAMAHDAWDADRRAELAAQRLGLAHLDPDRAVGTLSGGERTRLALAAIMTRRPACLLLDEPTNHLDDEAAGLLGEFLRDLPGMVLLASHDRVLLDEVATELLDLDVGPGGASDSGGVGGEQGGLDGRGGRRFGGGWTAYEEHRRRARRRWEETYTAQQAELDRLRVGTRIDTRAVAHDRAPRDNDKFVYGFKGARVERTLARRRHQAQRQLEAAESGQVRKPPAPLRLRTELTSGGPPGRIVRIRDLRVTGRLALEHCDVHAGEHLLVTGLNGAGKSTLLGVLAGRVPVSGGTVEVSARRTAELPQDVRFDDARASAEATYRALVGERRADEVPLRGTGLLHPRDLRTPVGLLSLGQRRRLGLAVAVASAPDLLLLDEPTNHVSLALVAELEEALQRTAGTLVVASHDRWLRRRWEGATLVLRPAARPS